MSRMMLVSWKAMPRSWAYFCVWRSGVAEDFGGEQADDAGDP